MKSGLQFGKWLAALAACAALALPGFAQGGRANRDQNRPPKQEQKQQRQNPQPNRPQRQRQEERRAPREEQRNANRPPQANPSRPFADERPNRNPNRPPNRYAPSPRTATPQELRRNEQQFNRLPPQQKQEMRERAQAWDRLTPDQRSHIRNDVAPRWQQLPADRQRAIRSRLNVLKNMPESARNQHLNDPNFTRGMSEEDRAMLRDLSHLHIGGPDAPPNE